MNTARVVVFVLVVVTALLAVIGFRNQIATLLRSYLQWTEDHTLAGILTYSSLYATLCVFLISGALLSLAAGAIFGPVIGVIVVWTGAFAGLCITFLIGRYVLRDWVARMTQKSGLESWQAIEAAVAQQGWQIVLLLRLAPVLPFNLLNYALSLSAVTFRQYSLASVIGILPGTIMYVYVGSVARDVQDILDGNTRLSPALTIAIFVLSGVAIGACVTLITLYARRAINKRIDGGHSLSRSLEEDFDEDDGNAVEEEHFLSERRPLSSASVHQ